MMDPLYLTDDEVRARNRLNYRDFHDTMRYGSFASEYGWDQKVVDRNSSSYLANMYAYIGAKGRATGAYSDADRQKIAKENDAEDTTTRDKSLQEIRDINPFLEDMTDEQLTKHIKRGQRREIEHGQRANT